MSNNLVFGVDDITAMKLNTDNVLNRIDSTSNFSFIVYNSASVVTASATGRIIDNPADTDAIKNGLKVFASEKFINSTILGTKWTGNTLTFGDSSASSQVARFTFEKTPFTRPPAIVVGIESNQNKWYPILYNVSKDGFSLKLTYTTGSTTVPLALTASADINATINILAVGV